MTDREQIERLVQEYGVACYAYSGEEQEGATYDALMSALEGLASDAARYRWLRDLKCNQLHLSRDGEHAANYRTAKEWIEQDVPDDFDECSAEELQKMKDTNTIWQLQFYPATPIGFHCVYASTLDAAIDAAGGTP